MGNCLKTHDETLKNEKPSAKPLDPGTSMEGGDNSN